MSLITKKQIREFKKTFGPEALEQNIGRQTGKTTRLALRTLLYVLDNPGEVVQIRDHHETRYADQYLLRVMKEMVFRLELDHIKFNERKGTVVFDWEDPWKEV